MNHLFPKEIIQFSAEDHFRRNNVRGKPLYITAILLLTGSIIALPLIKVDITFSARGILRTAENPSRIIVPVSGEIKECSIKTNCFVEKEDTLMIINHDAIDNEISTSRTALSLINSYINDLERLIAGKSARNTERYIHVEMECSHEINLLINDLNYTRDNYLTNKQLFEEGYIARVDFELIHNQLLSAETRLEMKRKEFQNRWEAELSVYKLEALQMKSKLAHLEKSKELHFITAPLSGYIVDYNDLTAGSYLAANDMVARIVPEQDLVATCMVSPDKISRIRVGQDVKFNIDTYPGTAYGRIKGTVASISEDATFYSDIPGFPIICHIHQEFSNPDTPGSAKLKSGMTFTGLFIITQRTLWQLIIEKGEKLLLPTHKDPGYDQKQAN
jgi:membrane fusion protein, peptide pheromone/bacteriocin exporter